MPISLPAHKLLLRCYFESVWVLAGASGLGAGCGSIFVKMFEELSPCGSTFDRNVKITNAPWLNPDGNASNGSALETASDADCSAGSHFGADSALTLLTPPSGPRSSVIVTRLSPSGINQFDCNLARNRLRYPFIACDIAALPGAALAGAGLLGA